MRRVRAIVGPFTSGSHEPNGRVLGELAAELAADGSSDLYPYSPTGQCSTSISAIGKSFGFPVATFATET